MTCYWRSRSSGTEGRVRHDREPRGARGVLDPDVSGTRRRAVVRIRERAHAPSRVDLGGRVADLDRWTFGGDWPAWSGSTASWSLGSSERAPRSSSGTACPSRCPSSTSGAWRSHGVGGGAPEGCRRVGWRGRPGTALSFRGDGRHRPRGDRRTHSRRRRLRVRPPPTRSGSVVSPAPNWSATLRSGRQRRPPVASFMADIET